jgi:hypothetical protein
LLCSVAGLWAGILLAGTAPDASTNGLELIPDHPALWTESFLWDKDINLRAGIGYKDNVLLSPTSPQDSGFFTSGLDLTIFRLPLNGLAFNFTVTGDDVRYWRDVGGVQGEDSFLASAQIEKYLQEQWRVGLELKDLYADQVALALSQTGGVSAVVAKGDTLQVRPFVRRDLGTNWWIQLGLPVEREWWQTPLDDDWRYGAQVVLAHTYGRGSQVALTYGGAYIAHGAWLATDEAGTEIPGKKLALWQQTVELKWVHHWDAAQRWRSITKLGFQYEQDNGGGFYDYYLYSLSEELRFTTKNWEIKGTAGVSYYDFPVQPAEPTSPSPTLDITTLNLTLRAERRLYKSLKLFGSFAYERALSNQPESQYKVNVLTGGLRWEL